LTLTLAVAGCTSSPKPSVSGVCKRLTVVPVSDVEIAMLSQQTVDDITSNNEAIIAWCWK
jgi:hypothetical protein